MFVEFNPDFEDPPTGSGKWYYGTDGLVPPGDNGFLGIALHEIGHTLGISKQINSITGQNYPSDMPFWMLNFVVRRGTTNLFFDDMTDTERLAAITSGEVYFSGPAVIAAGMPPSALNPYPANPQVNALGEPKLYAPSPLVAGSFISHWDEYHYPDERFLLMRPGLSNPLLNIDYTKEMLMDLGWTFQAAPEIQVAPASHSFSFTHISAGPTAAKTVTITNTGSVDLDVIGIALIDGFQNSDAGQFQITNSTTPGPVAPGQAREITVVFDPDSAGSKSAFIRVFSTDTHEWVEKVSLSGVAYDGTNAVSWVDFNFLGDELGTQVAPFNTFTEGVSYIVAGGTVNIVPGTTPEIGTFDKAMTLANVGVPPDLVRIGDIGARSIGSRNVEQARVGFISGGIEPKKTPDETEK